jgi:transglutaminase-like putative cysteine protease
MALPTMRFVFAGAAASAVFCLAACTSLFSSDEYASLSSERRFLFDYTVEIPARVNPQLGAVRVWVPVPVSDGVQTVDVLTTPEGARWSAADEHGNRFCSVLWTGGERTLRWSYRIDRVEDDGDSNGADRVIDQAEAFMLYLDPDVMVPSRGPASEVAFEIAETIERSDFPTALYRHIVDKTEFSTDRNVGFGSSDYPAAEGLGDATDYASFFVGGMRYKQFAARFQIGFLLPFEHGSGELELPHAWAHWYRPGHGWMPVDPAAADLDPDRDTYYFGQLGSNRVSLSCGRDLSLDPVQIGSKLNFFVAAYAEQDGREVRLQTKAGYADL